MKHHRLGQEAALNKAKDLLVAAFFKPDTVSCEDVSKQGLLAWAACMCEHHGEALRSAATKHRHDENLLLAVAYTESKGNPLAVSTSWCLSLMQILPSTAEKFGVDLQRIFDPHVNFDTGARVLRSYLDIARGDLNYGLASYNLGPGSVRDRINSAQGFEPRSFEYTKKVQRVFRELRAGGSLHKTRVASAPAVTVKPASFQLADAPYASARASRPVSTSRMKTAKVALRPIP